MGWLDSLSDRVAVFFSAVRGDKSMGSVGVECVEHEQELS